MIGSIVLHVGMLAAGTVLTWKGSGVLERAAGQLSARYRLPPIVHGSLVVAVASSFPELTTTVASALVHGEFALGMASIVGSAIFNILVIPGLACVSGRCFAYDLRLVYRDAQFYLTSIAALLLAFSFALIYEPVPDRALTGTMTRSIALLPLALYGLYLFLQQQEYRDPDAPPAAAEAPEPEEPRGSALGDWARLLLGLVLVVVGVEGLLRTAIWLGDVLGTPPFLWGATVVAAATSIPDAIISVRAARRGDPDLSLGNVLGSNIFDLLVAIPVGVLIAGPSPIDYGVAAPLMAVLVFATIVLFAAMRTGVELSRRESIVLLGLYAGFIGLLVLDAAGVVSMVR